MKSIASIFAAGLALVSLHTLNYHRRKIFATERKLREPEEPVLSPVIVVLIHENTRLDDLCLSMKTLVNVKGSDTAPVLAFHLRTTPELEQQIILQQCTTRSVLFAVVDIDTFPVGFVPEEGVDYSSAQINRFWTSGIWKHKAMHSFNLIMKIDHDTCFAMKTDLPNFSTPYHKFKSHYFPGTVELNPVRLEGMHEFALEYMADHNMDPTHETLWQKVHFTYHSQKTVPNFQDSFELVRKDFMLRADIYEWLNALTDLPPYGYFNEGWNVNAERFLTMAMFGSKSAIDLQIVEGFLEKDLNTGRRNHEICTDPFV